MKKALYFQNDYPLKQQNNVCLILFNRNGGVIILIELETKWINFALTFRNNVYFIFLFSIVFLTPNVFSKLFSFYFHFNIVQLLYPLL